MPPEGWVHNYFSCQLTWSPVLEALGSCVEPRKKEVRFIIKLSSLELKTRSHSFTSGNFSGCCGATSNKSWQQCLSSLLFCLWALGPHLYTWDTSSFLAQRSFETINKLSLHILKGQSWTDDKGRHWTWWLWVFPYFLYQNSPESTVTISQLLQFVSAKP